MAITITKPVAGSDYAVSNKKAKVRKLVFSGNYATGGESVTAASVGLKTIDQCVPHGVAMSTDLATSNPIGISYATGGASVTFIHYEAAATGLALLEKTNGEAHATGSNVRVTFIGS